MVNLDPEKVFVRTNKRVTKFYGDWRKRESDRLFSDEQIRRMRTLKNAGATYRTLGEMFDVSHVTAYHICKKSIYSDVI
ncbi:MAG: hypothetical protein RBR68_13600 [Tenuifilaceae bacterium]|nr:hypothetical protein [Tenuifilaceae bacterium]